MRRMAAAGRAERRRLEKRCAPGVKKLLLWVAEQTVHHALNRYSFRRVETETVGMDVWAAFETALDNVMQEYPIQAAQWLIPMLQDGARIGYRRTSELLNQEAVQAVENAMFGNTDRIASRITSIGETTRDKFRQVISDAAKEGMPVGGLAEEIYKRFEDVSLGRVPTIARTEMMNAYNDGSVAAFKASSTVTHVSVIGCMSRERDKWNDPAWQQFMWRGEATCNIEDVSVVDCDKLQFHYNHTGCMVASKFRTEETA